MKFTKAQEEAIRIEGGTQILVSAAAGAGKTTVLTERLFVRLSEGKVSPSELLVLTFTERAAAEMKHRIEKRFDLAVKDASGSEKERLQAILARLPEASMSTIHAFCNSVVREFTAELKDSDGEPLLEPGYSVLDPEAADCLLDQAAEEVLKTFYHLESKRRQEGEVDFEGAVSGKLPLTSADIRPFALVEILDENAWLDRFMLTVRALSRGYSDDSLKNLLLTTLATLRSLPHYPKRLKESLLSRQADGGFFAPKRSAERMETLLIDVKKALDDFSKLKAEPYYQRAFDPKEKAKMVIAMGQPLVEQEALLNEINALFAAFSPAFPEWDDIVSITSRFPPMKLPSLTPRAKDFYLQEAFFSLYGETILPLVWLLSGSILSKTALLRYAPDVLPLYILSKEKIEADEQATNAVLTCFSELTLLVDQRYRTLKVRQNAVDFSDFEHYALELLEQPHVASILDLRIKEIYLDEYQDTSSIQDAILEQIGEACRFMVGDVKQSIYRFRHANPSLFLSKTEAYQDEENGRLVLLNENFRSRKRILLAVNRIFARLMEDPAGEIVYDHRHRLIPGRKDETADPKVTLLYVREAAQVEEMPTEDEDFSDLESPDLTVLPSDTPLFEETTVTVSEIVKLLSTGTKPDDIAILGRTSAICGAYYRALRLSGIPVSGVSRENYRDSAEYRTLYALAAVTVNRRHDIELASLMLSDFLAEPFDENELLDMRLFSYGNASFADAVEGYAEEGTDGLLQEKTVRFLDTLTRRTDLAAELSVIDWFRAVLQESGYEDTVTRGKDGRQRLANIRLFLKRLEEMAPRDLRDFLAAEEQGQARPGGAKSFTERTILPGTVQILTMHASKGLEFPVVFVCGLGSPWRADSAPPLTFSETFGLTGYTFDAETLLLRTNASHRDALGAKASADRQEEWRLLYVALTRAKEKLYLVVRESWRKSVPDPAVPVFELISDGRIDFDKAISTSYGHRLLFAALALDDAASLNHFFSNLDAEVPDVESGDITFCHRQPLLSWPTLPAKKAALDVADEVTDDRTITSILRLLTEETPQLAAADAPAKLTVSEMKRRLDTELIRDGDSEVDTALIRDLAFTVVRPDRPDRNEAKELGTILHTVFQFLEVPRLREDPRTETFLAMLNEMVEKNRLEEDEAKRAEPFAEEAILFARSEIGAMLSDPKTTAYREMPFTLSVPIPELPEEIALVQGIIDLWFITAEDEIWLLDFKSDAVTSDQTETLEHLMVKRYGVQLRYYARAIEKAVGKKVNYALVWLIREGVAVDVSSDAAEGEII